MKWPTYASWFANARIVSKMGTSLVPRPSLKQMTVGNIVIVGDAGASVECWIQGAGVGGYKAVKALQKQWDGQDGYREYTDWWAQAFAGEWSPAAIAGAGALRAISTSPGV